MTKVKFHNTVINFLWPQFQQLKNVWSANF